MQSNRRQVRILHRRMTELPYTRGINGVPSPAHAPSQTHTPPQIRVPTHPPRPVANPYSVTICVRIQSLRPVAKATGAGFYGALGMRYNMVVKVHYNAGSVYAAQPPFYEASLPDSKPLSKHELQNYQEVWLEPISHDTELREQLRGTYRVYEHRAENNFGNRFSLDTYGVKWLAFSIK